MSKEHPNPPDEGLTWTPPHWLCWAFLSFQDASCCHVWMVIPIQNALDFTFLPPATASGTCRNRSKMPQDVFIYIICQEAAELPKIRLNKRSLGPVEEIIRDGNRCGSVYRLAAARVSEAPTTAAWAV